MDTTYADFAQQFNEALARAAAEIDPRWAARNYVGHEPSNGVAWIAGIYYDGDHIGSAEDAGRGGAVSFWFTSKTARALWEAEVERLRPGDGGGADLVIEALLQKGGN